MLLRRYGALLAVLAFVLTAQPGWTEDKKDEKKTETKKVEKKTVSLAHIKLSGSLEEAPPSSDPLFGSLKEHFKSKLDRIEKARKDANVQAIYLQLDGLSIGWGKLDELSRAIAEVRKSGKKVFAYLESGNTKDYLLALACDEICLPESDWLMLTGMRAEVSFYKNLFEKIGAQADMLQMGDFKAAAEPFMRNSMSKPARAQLTRVIDDYYENSLVERIVHARASKNFTAEQVKKLIDEGPYTARGALEAGLVDRLGYADDYRNQLKETLKKQHQADKFAFLKDYGKEEKKDIDLSNPFAIFKLLATPVKSKSSSHSKIAVIYATGVITTGKSEEGLFGSETLGSTTMIKAIRQAEEDETVKAIVLRVDSPGGSALASDLIWNELKRSKKPVIASMSDVAASGGYYISMAAQKIYAEPGTLTGSIGVVGGKLAIGGTLNKIGITTEIISRGANAGILSSDKPFTDSERKAMTALMKDVYDQFLDKALAGRKKAGRTMTREELVQLAGGRIWTGRQAKENGLIDELGTLGDAIEAARKLAKLPEGKEPELLLLPKSKSFLDTLFEEMGDTRAPSTRFRSLLRGAPELQRKLRGLDGLFQLRGEPVWLTLPYHIEIE
ncbi:MAG TPA: signal peptide peptidase SppA [Gemmataceae bacterium]|nr:signal peptide peptidase SppA [Gemmataceae bacterium]